MIKRMRFMTRREYVKKHYPLRLRDDACGGVLGCPGDTHIENRKNNCYHDFQKCGECWDKPVLINGKYILVNKEVHDNAKK